MIIISLYKSFFETLPCVPKSEFIFLHTQDIGNPVITRDDKRGRVKGKTSFLVAIKDERQKNQRITSHLLFPIIL